MSTWERCTSKNPSNLSWKNTKAIISQKMLNGTLAEIASCGFSKRAEGEKGADIVNDKAKGHNIEIHELSFISSHTKVSLLGRRSRALTLALCSHTRQKCCSRF